VRPSCSASTTSPPRIDTRFVVAVITAITGSARPVCSARSKQKNAPPVARTAAGSHGERATAAAPSRAATC
jgi:hypothetical protein